MADVIRLSDRQRINEPPPTIEALAITCTDEISANWERFARNNRLNDYFVQSVPAWVHVGVDYLSDLNALSGIEAKIKLAMMVSAPGVSNSKQLGWMAMFNVNGVMVGTPSMFSEAYARCFNILLFLKLGRELTKHGIVVE